MLLLDEVAVTRGTCADKTNTHEPPTLLKQPNEATPCSSSSPSSLNRSDNQKAVKNGSLHEKHSFISSRFKVYLDFYMPITKAKKQRIKKKKQIVLCNVDQENENNLK